MHEESGMVKDDDRIIPEFGKRTKTLNIYSLPGFFETCEITKTMLLCTKK